MPIDACGVYYCVLIKESIVQHLSSCSGLFVIYKHHLAYVMQCVLGDAGPGLSTYRVLVELPVWHPGVFDRSVGTPGVSEEGNASSY